MRTSDMVVDIEKRDDLRQSSRYPLAVQRDCTMCIITFKDLAWKDAHALLKDISTNGIGVESEKQINSGFVWFRDRIGGHRSGILMWSRQVGYSYRAGIQFIPLSREEEKFVNGQVSLLRSEQPLGDPAAIMSMIMESMERKPKH